MSFFVQKCLFSYFTTLFECYELSPFEDKKYMIEYWEGCAEKVLGNDRNLLSGILYKMQKGKLDPRLGTSEKFFKTVKLNAQKLRLMGVKEQRNSKFAKHGKTHEQICKLIRDMR